MFELFINSQFYLKSVNRCVKIAAKVVRRVFLSSIKVTINDAFHKKIVSKLSSVL